YSRSVRLSAGRTTSAKYAPRAIAVAPPASATSMMRRADRVARAVIARPANTATTTNAVAVLNTIENADPITRRVRLRGPGWASTRHASAMSTRVKKASAVYCFRSLRINEIGASNTTTPATAPANRATEAFFQGRPRATTYAITTTPAERSEEHTSELQSLAYLVCRLL